MIKYILATFIISSILLSNDMLYIDEISINVYDVNGMHVATLMNEIKSAGYYTITWNANSHPTGMYFI